MTIGINIKRLRERFGYSQSELAELTGIPQALICYYENDARTPSVFNARKLAEVFKVTIEQLMDGKEE